MLASEPELFEFGCYGKYLEPWVDAYGRDRVLCLVLENASRELAATKALVAGFLGVDARRFPEHAGDDVANQGATPKHRALYRVATSAFQWTRRHDLDWIFGPLKRSTSARLVFGLGQGAKPPPISPRTRRELAERYRPHNERLAAMFGLDLSVWLNDGVTNAVET
jgi:hypothetical protein